MMWQRFCFALLALQFCEVCEGTTVRTDGFEVPLYGKISQIGYYFSDIWVGTPLQRSSVIVDTGSPLVGFPCSACNKCGTHIDAPFNFSLSSTHQWKDCSTAGCFQCGRYNACSYRQSYSEGSRLEGIYYQDQVVVGSKGNPAFSFDYLGCHTVETNLFTTQKAAGIMGLSKRNDPKRIMNHMLQLVTHDEFSLCIAEEGGVLTIGQFDPLLLSFGSTINTTPQLGNTYEVHLHSLTIEGTRIGSSRQFGKVLIDSGSTYSYLPEPVYHRVRQTLKEHCLRLKNECEPNEHGSYCFKADNPTALFEKLPNFVLEFDSGVIFAWRPDSYLHRGPSKAWCDGIQSESFGTTVLGMTFFKNNIIVFKDKPMTIGFARGNCPTHRENERDLVEYTKQLPLSKAEVFPAPIQPIPNSETSHFSPFVVWIMSIVVFGIIMTSLAVVVCDAMPPKSDRVENVQLASIIEEGSVRFDHELQAVHSSDSDGDELY